MRRLLTPLLLIALVLCAQQGALVHALAHGVVQATAILPDSGHPAPGSGNSNAHCDKCFAFAHVAAAVSAALATQVAQADDFAPAQRYVPGVAPGPRLATHSRDPPTVL